MPEGFIKQPITTYFISGIWTDHTAQPSYFAVHQYLNPGVSGSTKMTKEQVIRLIESGRYVYTWEWDYNKGRFDSGQLVYVYDGYKGKYLTTLPIEQRTNNLRHLVSLNWFITTLAIICLF